VIVAVVAAILTGCGVGPRRTLDAHSVAAQITSELAGQYGLAPALISVRCPSGISVVVGQAFVCDATLDGEFLSIAGQVASGRGRYTIKPAAAVIVVARAVSVLESDITAAVHAPANVSCGTRPVLVVVAGGSFACTATVKDGPQAVTVTVADLQGNVRYSLAPPASAAG
jgi:hypothetical protein